jgi:PAS domain S-box-containing protein
VKDLEDRRFVGLLEAAPDAMVCVDSDGQIALVNAQAERLFGYDRDELVGQPVEMLVPDTVRPVHPGHRAGYVANPQPRPMGAGQELAGRRRDGTTFPAEISLSAIGTDEGILVTAAVRDVTERRQAHENAARLASIIQSSHDAVIGKTLDQVITSWNPAAERLYGYTAEEMIGRPVEMLFPPAERERESQLLAAVARGERVEEHRTHRVRGDGSIVSVSLTLSPITDSTGAITGISTVARDVTERQRAEARFVGLLEAAPDAMVCADLIRELQPGICVLYMSGYTEGLLSAQGVLEPGISLVEKPFTEASLLTKVRGILHARGAAEYGVKGT